MKKIAAIISSLGFLVTATAALAIDIGIKTPPQGINPATPIGTLISNALTIVFVIAAILVLVFLIIGAFQWIVSGGDKEAVSKARGRIIAALVGLVLLALAFLITRVVGQIVNIDILNLNKIPTLSECSGANQVFDPKLGCIQVTPTAVPVRIP